MAIFRGTGGQGDSTTDATVTEVTQQAVNAANSATAAASSASSASTSATSAATSETNASTSATNAATSATNAATSETNAETAKVAAEAAQAAAETAETNAETAETNAETAQTAAEASQAAAEAAQTAAETAETNAETAETNAETAYANTLAIFGDATDVQNAVDDAEKLAINPEDSQYTLSDAVTTGYSALHYAAKAEDYKTAAEVAKTSAETAQGLAETAETAAETAQGLAETAQTAAETAQSAAETAQTAAETAQTAAETAETNAETAETNAASSANSASGSATSASTSADTATTKASEASTSATNAATSESNASTSATNAANSATAAQTAQTAAETAQAAAEAAQEAIDGLYLGTATSNPTVDLNGDPVTAGDWYFNTTDNTTRIYDGSAWNTVNPDLVGDSSPQLGGDLDLNSNDITGTGNIDITGTVTADGLTVDTSVGVTLEGTGVSADHKIVRGTGATNNSRPVLTLDADTTQDALDNFGPSLKFTISDTAVDDSELGAIGFLRDGDDGSGKFVVSQDSQSLGTSPQFTISSNGNISFYEDTRTTAKLTWDASNEKLDFQDNVAARFGTGYDLQIYHDSSNSWMYNFTGSLNIVNTSNDNDVNIWSDNGSGGVTTYFKADGNVGEAILYHYGSQKLATKSTGIDVTGTVTADSLTVDSTGSAQSVITTSTDGSSYVSLDIGGFVGTPSIPREVAFFTNVFGEARTERMRIDSNGRLGIGTTSPDDALQVVGGNIIIGEPNENVNRSLSIHGSNASNKYAFLSMNDSKFIIDGSVASQFLEIGNSSNSVFASQTYTVNTNLSPSYFAWKAGSTEIMRATEDGRLGIGTTSPAEELHITATTPTIKLEASSGSTYNTQFLNYYNSAKSFEITNGGFSILRSSLQGYSNISIGTDSKARIDISQSDNSIIFNNNTSEAARIDSSGNLLVGTTTSPSDTNTIVASAGIYLGGTGSANLLDDYEEGTFNASFNNEAGDLSATASLSFNRVAMYRKVGSVVYITLSISTSGTITGTASSPVVITGLPFTSNQSGTASLCNVSPSPAAAYNSMSVIPKFLLIGDNVTQGTLFKEGASDDIQVLTSDLAASGNANRIHITGFYFTDS